MRYSHNITRHANVHAHGRDSENRTMPKWLWTSRAAMSVELCAHIAAAEHWPVFGLQYGMEVSAVRLQQQQQTAVWHASA